MVSQVSSERADGLLMTRYGAASAGKQCIAGFTDVLLIAVTAMAIYLPTRNVPLTLLWVLQCIVLMAVLEGTRGVTPAKALLGIRSVRAEGLAYAGAGVVPTGLKRSALKYLVLLGCACIPVVGLPAAVASPLFSKHSAQGWAERLAGIAVVDMHDSSLVSVSRTKRSSTEGMDTALPDVSLDMLVVPEAPHYTSGVQTPRVMPHMPSAVTPAVPTASSSASAARRHMPEIPDRAASEERRQPPQSNRRPDNGHRAKPNILMPALPERPAATPAPAAAKPSQLLLFLENTSGIPLASSASIVLGRKPQKQSAGDTVIQVEDTTGTVSRSHALLEIKNGRIWITDLGSTNGTQIMCDGEEKHIAAHVRTEINSGSRISLGDVSCSIAAAGRGMHS